MSTYQKIKLSLLVVFSIALLLILKSYSDNGRYIFNMERNLIIDTRSGSIYNLKRWNRINIENFEELKEKNNEAQKLIY